MREQEKPGSRAKEYHRQRPQGMELYGIAGATGKVNVKSTEGIARFLKSICTKVQASSKVQTGGSEFF